MRLVALGLLVAGVADARPDELAGQSVIFARGGELVKSDARGKDEVVIAQLPAHDVKPTVRALRSDAKGKVLLVDLAGKWSWLATDAGKLAALPCGDGPAQLAEDGSAVLCRDPKSPHSLVIELPSGKATPLAVPTAGARLVGKTVVWLEGKVFSAPAADLAKKTIIGPELPLRSFLASPDGTRAFGVFKDYLYEGRRKKVPAELLMGFALDGRGARRKALPGTAVPIEWSHGGEYVLVQDGSAACLVRATGGQYKCWKGYTAASIAPDGSYALVNRDGALYRARLNGPYVDPPQLVTKVVDGAAVWLPGVR